MDELKLSLRTNFMRNLVAKAIKKAIGKKLGTDLDILINDIKLTSIDGKIHIHADVDAEMTNENLLKLVQTFGKD